MKAEDFGRPIYRTKDWILVDKVDGTFVFLQKPNNSELKVGDLVPPEMGLYPANKIAERERENESTCA